MHQESKQINIPLFISLLGIFFFLFSISFYTLLPSDTGPEPSRVLVVLEKIAEFPLVLIFKKNFSIYIELYFLGFFLNAVLFSFVLERCISILKVRAKSKPSPNNSIERKLDGRK